jgi:glycosyltransferase involved in cell wall biosynthesis
MSTPPLVSVLMTAYNREKYIAEAMESVLASSYSNFELIAVDDCSKDRTVDIARTYEKKDDRVKVYVNEVNLGDYPNRNKAASYATGKYLKYVDADDYIYPWGLGLLIIMMERFPEAGWGLCSLDQYRGRPFPFELSPREAYEYNYSGPGLFHKAPLSSIIRREVFEKEKGFSSLRMVGDFEMWHRLALRYKVVLMPQGIVWYREHGEQEIKSFNQFAGIYEKLIFEYLSHPECPLEKSAAGELLRKMKGKKNRKIVKAILQLKFRRAYNDRKELKSHYV